MYVCLNVCRLAPDNQSFRQCTVYHTVMQVLCSLQCLLTQQAEDSSDNCLKSDYIIITTNTRGRLMPANPLLSCLLLKREVSFFFYRLVSCLLRKLNNLRFETSSIPHILLLECDFGVCLLFFLFFQKLFDVIRVSSSM